jgi:hypothetical protein
MNFKCRNCEGYGSERGRICHVCRGSGTDPTVWIILFLVMIFLIMYGVAGLVSAITQVMVHQYTQ